MRSRSHGGKIMSNDDTSYYRQRAVTERAMALEANRQNVREIHEELARQYDALVARAELRPTRSTVMPNASRAMADA
jgi:hypothetical protein